MHQSKHFLTKIQIVKFCNCFHERIVCFFFLFSNQRTVNLFDNCVNLKEKFIVVVNINVCFDGKLHESIKKRFIEIIYESGWQFFFFSFLFEKRDKDCDFQKLKKKKKYNEINQQKL